MTPPGETLSSYLKISKVPPPPHPPSPLFIQGVLAQPHGLLEKKCTADGLQDLPRPQLLTGRNHLCQGLRATKEAEVWK